MRRALFLFMLAAGCSSAPTVCPFPVDGGAPGGPCMSGDSDCDIWTKVLVTPSCGVDTEFACTCSSDAWKCSRTNSSHNACTFDDGGSAN